MGKITSKNLKFVNINLTKKMDRFSQFNDISDNLLPEDGRVFYHGMILEKEETKTYFERLMKNIEWINDEVLIFGRRIVTKRKVAWYAEKPFK